MRTHIELLGGPKDGEEIEIEIEPAQELHMPTQIELKPSYASPGQVWVTLEAAVYGFKNRINPQSNRFVFEFLRYDKPNA